MKIGDILKVRNYLGIMTIKIDEELIQSKDYNIMNANDQLGKFNNLRVEFYEEGYITLYSNELGSLIYLILPPFNYEELKVFRCRIIETEQKEYDLNRIEIVEEVK